MVYHSVRKGFWLYRDWVVHDTFAMYPPLPPTPRSTSSSKLSPLHAPWSPVARAERSKPCPVALVPTLGCFWPPPPSLLLTSALSGSISITPRSVFMLRSKRSMFSRTRLGIPQEKIHRFTHTQTFSLVPRRARARTAGECRVTLVCTHAHKPTARFALRKMGPKLGLETSNANNTHSPALLKPMRNLRF